MRLGIDPSTYFEVLEKSPRFRVEGNQVEPLSYLHDKNGVSLMRIRLWIDPRNKKGVPYHGGTNDFAAFVKLAKLGLEKGYEILLDFHYSDFWCDPSKQMVPKSWRGLSYEQLVDMIGHYTRSTLLNLKKEGIPLHGIQIGNEITNGMLWPFGKIERKGDLPATGFDRLFAFLNEASKACREVYPSSKIVVHLEKSHDVALYTEYFDYMVKNGLDFDVIGMSYYPYWHGTFPMLFQNVDAMKTRYQKPVWIVETGYGFTMAPFVENGNNLICEDFFQKGENVYRPYPLSKDGQRDFLENLLYLAEVHGVEEIYYWEPLWLPLPGLEWASKEGEEYINETGKPTNNEWANQCLFDYEGNATPGLFVFSLLNPRRHG